MDEALRAALEREHRAPLLDRARLERLHRLAALEPPATPEAMDQLRAELEPLVAMLHLALNIGSLDPCVSASPPITALHGEALEACREADTQPLPKRTLEGGGGRWHAGFFVA